MPDDSDWLLVVLMAFISGFVVAVIVSWSVGWYK
jgi:hypothetical protein